MPRHLLTALWLVVLLPFFAAPAFGSESPIAGGRWRGVFEPREEAVIPAEVSMRVLRMPKGPGDRCEEGELLVEFDPALPDAAVLSAEARLRAAELGHTGAVNLFEKNQATPMEVARAESEVAAARLELAAARREARACRVLAPFSGKMVESRVREHEWANRGSPLLVLVDDALLRVRFFLPEENFSRIRLGDTVRIWAPAVSRRVTGTVARLGVVFDPVSRTFDVWADVANDDDGLRAGMTAEVEWPVTASGTDG